MTEAQHWNGTQKWDGRDVTFRSYSPAQALTLNVASRTIVSIDMDGRVTLGDGVTVDEAARAFWAAVERHAMASKAKIGN